MEHAYLIHHGILGMKWGKKNGPPYPLDFNRLSSEEREKAKKDSIEKGDVRTAYLNRSHYTNQEIYDLINRFDLESKLSTKVSDLTKSEIAAGKEKLNKFTNALTTVEEITSATSHIVSNVATSISKIDAALGKGNKAAEATKNVSKNVNKVVKTIEKKQEKEAKKQARQEAKAEKQAQRDAEYAKWQKQESERRRREQKAAEVRKANGIDYNQKYSEIQSMAQYVPDDLLKYWR